MLYSITNEEVYCICNMPLFTYISSNKYILWHKSGINISLVDYKGGVIAWRLRKITLMVNG